MTLAEKYINLLVQILAIPSISRKEDTRAVFLQNWLKNEGLTVLRVKNNLIITSGNEPAKAEILLNSHLDTISPGDGWSSDPYLPQRKNGCIVGLGSNDAGASLVSLAAAYKQLAENNLTDKIVLLLSAEEEVSGENGISSVLYLLPSLKFAIVGEPTGMHAAVAERGLMVIDAIARGTAGHAARDEGENAIYNAFADVAKLRDLKFSDHSEWLKDPSINVTMINAGTGHNVIPDKAEFVVDVRSNDKYSNENLLLMLSQICTSELNPRSMRLKSSFLDHKHPVFKALHDLGLKTYGSPTLSDMALLEIPAVKIGPGDSSRSHTADEFIYTDEISQGIDIYSRLISSILTLEL